ncbi:hypothetical protein [Flavobacterium wongokense]|uniref:hypothetical protein n=1 Tax=Flavobacterium wongokense TaxID=2910674 RepID=UPI001F1F59DA|nr:hypothetical protein [Flavobacterium sp. WG47]MCF6132422.1 hypothetical protein [Flavobacterium sp. WG47]
MKKLILTFGLLIGLSATAQEHFSGISTSNRVGILNGSLNPAEFANLSKKFEINFIGVSLDVANNKVGFSDLVSGDDLETLIFTGNDPVNMRFDGQIMGPGFATKWFGWGFAITTKANAKFDVVDVDPTIGQAIVNDNLILNTTLLDNPGNQRVSGTSYGEIGLSVAKQLVNTENHSFNAGITLKILFPGSYSNAGLKDLNGTITQNATGAYLTTNAPATLNIAYSGNLADSFTNFNDYSKSIFGGLNGFAGDIGVTYEWKDGNNGYKLKAGASIRNIGSMTFKDDNNYNTNYTLNIPTTNPLDLSQFSDVDNLSEVEQILLDGGYLTETRNKTDFKVNLPTTFSLYADLKIIPKFYVTGYLQQRMKKDDSDNQITAKNIVSLTPRFNIGIFEAYVPFSHDDVSGTNVGAGFRWFGFYLGSNSIFTSLADGKQADAYIGYRLGFL